MTELFVRLDHPVVGPARSRTALAPAPPRRHDLRGELTRLVDGLVAALAQQPPSSARTANDPFVEGASG